MLRNYKFLIKEKHILLATLYGHQIKYWNSKLKTLASKNQACYNKQTAFQYGIIYNNRNWHANSIQNLELENKFSFCLPIHPDFPQLLEEAKIIIDNLQEIDDEKYEVDRFLTGLLQLNLSKDEAHEILGDTLFSIYSSVQKEHWITDYVLNYSTDENRNKSIRSFVDKNRNIIKKMQERIVLNLILPSN